MPALGDKFSCVLVTRTVVDSYHPKTTVLKTNANSPVTVMANGDRPGHRNKTTAKRAATRREHFGKTESSSPPLSATEHAHNNGYIRRIIFGDRAGLGADFTTTSVSN